jgi:hypothetical protein
LEEREVDEHYGPEFDLLWIIEGINPETKKEI